MLQSQVPSQGTSEPDYFSGHQSDDLIDLEKELLCQHKAGSAKTTRPQTPTKDNSETDYFPGEQSDDLVRFEKALLCERRVRAKGDPWLGLALSGGGIRSATFCLGGLQALSEEGLLKYFDYLSSVSGGGYVACALQWWWSRPGSSFGPDRDNFPYGYRFGTDLDQKKRITDRILLYLRWHGKYLTPGDGITIWSAIAVVLRTICLNFFVWIAVATLVFYFAIKIGQAIEDYNTADESAAQGQSDPRTAPAWVLNPFPGAIVVHWYNNRNCGEEPLSTAQTLSVGQKEGTSTVIGLGASGIHTCYLTYPLGLAPFPWLGYGILLFFAVFAIALSLMSWISDRRTTRHTSNRCATPVSPSSFPAPAFRPAQWCSASSRATEFAPPQMRCLVSMRHGCSITPANASSARPGRKI
jgi:Patatin-like phospholipase